MNGTLKLKEEVKALFLFKVMFLRVVALGRCTTIKYWLNFIDKFSNIKYFCLVTSLFPTWCPRFGEGKIGKTSVFAYEKFKFKSHVISYQELKREFKTPLLSTDLI